MTTNQTIDGVPRELIEKAMLACFEAGFGIPHAELRALLDAESAPCAKSQVEPATQPQPDPLLCKFYDVSDYHGLVRELVGHVALLQDSAKRNVKPWEDTFPPTLLPAYIKRVNAENAAAQPQGEPAAWLVKCKNSGLVEQAEPNEKATNPDHWTDAFQVYAKPSAPASDPINYGSLDPVQRLAVCRGDVLPTSAAPAEPDRIKGMVETIGGQYAVMIDPENGHYGWTFKKHPDGQWVSGRKATEREMIAARSHAQITNQL